MVLLFSWGAYRKIPIISIQSRSVVLLRQRGTQHNTTLKFLSKEGHPLETLDLVCLISAVRQHFIFWFLTRLRLSNPLIWKIGLDRSTHMSRGAKNEAREIQSAPKLKWPLPPHSCYRLLEKWKNLVRSAVLLAAESEDKRWKWTTPHFGVIVRELTMKNPCQKERFRGHVIRNIYWTCLKLLLVFQHCSFFRLRSTKYR